MSDIITVRFNSGYIKQRWINAKKNFDQIKLEMPDYKGIRLLSADLNSLLNNNLTEKNYTLLTISELENFIRDNKNKLDGYECFQELLKTFKCLREAMEYRYSSFDKLPEEFCVVNLGQIANWLNRGIFTRTVGGVPGPYHFIGMQRISILSVIMITHLLDALGLIEDIQVVNNYLQELKLYTTES